MSKTQAVAEYASNTRLSDNLKRTRTGPEVVLIIWQQRELLAAELSFSGP